MALTAPAIAVPAALPGTESRRACAGAGPSWPTETLAVRGGTAWVACNEQFRVVRVALGSGAVWSRSVPYRSGVLLAGNTGGRLYAVPRF